MNERVQIAIELVEWWMCVNLLVVDEVAKLAFDDLKVKRKQIIIVQRILQINGQENRFIWTVNAKLLNLIWNQ